MPKPDISLLAVLELYLTETLCLHSRARRLAAAGLAAFGLTLFFTWVASQIVGFPTPFVQDEFCYLLTGETFASGRLAMPSHPMAYFFETFHQIQWPAHAAKYPPGQGLVLALGYLLGEPIYGVWLCAAALSSAFVWMLGGFTRVRWAFIGGLASGIWYAGFCYWAQSYWGGSLTALGAALVWGATRRLTVQPGVSAALALGFGVSFLFLTRPFEGFLACLVPAWLLCRHLIPSWHTIRGRNLLRSLLIASLPLCAAVVFFGACNRAATGSALRLVYSEYREQYDRNPIFLWERAQVPPEYHHPRMEEFDVLIQETVAKFPTPLGEDILTRIRVFNDFYAGGTLVLMLAALVLMPGHWVKAAATGVLVSLTSMILVFAFYRHYFAATAAPMLIWATGVARWLWLRFPARRMLFLSAIPAVFIILLLARGAGGSPTKAVNEFKGYRQGLLQKLEKEQGKHLVLVRYDRGVEPHVEYVFNGAHIDDQRIVWARWTEDAGSRGLYDYYKDRRFWLLTVRKQGEPLLREFNWVADSATKPIATPAVF